MISSGTKEGLMEDDWGDYDVVKIVGTEEEAAVEVGFLRESGIEAAVESLRASELPFDVGRFSEVRIRVPKAQAARAAALLDEREDVATGQAGEDAGEPLEVEGSTEP
jgi:hypothetical protein